MKRRSFVQGAAVALVVGFHWDEALARDAQEKRPPNPFDAWIRIDATGVVSLVVAKSEMGQGVMTALPLILAEELDVDWAKVKVEQALTDSEVYDHGTGGSTSLRTSWLPLRQAAAAARTMLVQAAAAHWQVGAETCRAERGFVVHGAREKRLSYGELVARARRLEIPNFNTVALKNSDDFRYVGKDVPRVDVPGKTDGTARFGLDVRVPGMLFAVVARCPVIGGKVRRFDATKANAVAGVRHVLELPAVADGAFTCGGVAVVADNTWAALQGRAALAIEWDPGPGAPESSAALKAQFEASLAGDGLARRDEGGAVAALAGAAKKLEAVYELPFQNHAPMEPMNATVHVRADGAEAWVPSQGPQWSRDMIATLTGFKQEQVKVHTTLMGGAFGRRFHSDFTVEATQVSKAVGAPIQLVWTREDDMRHGFYRPASMHRMEAGLDATGAPVAWRHRMTSVSIDAFWTPADRAKPESTELGGSVNLPYALPAIRVEYTPARSRIPVMWWRSVEHSHSGFVTEAFLDELAAAAGADPLAFRLKLLAEDREVPNPVDPEGTRLHTARLREVLKRVAAQAGWGRALPRGRGLGLAAHFSFHSYVAQVAEVSVSDGGQVRVHEVWNAVDVGRVVSPDGLRAQVEGAIAFGLSSILKGAITVSGGRVEQGNFDDFEVLRIDEMPKVHVVTVASTAPPTGMGEPGLPPLAAAVAGGIYAATGKRVRRLPIKPADLV